MRTRTEGDATAPSALDKALQLVAARPHFRAQLGRKLAERGYPVEEVEEALTRLAELGYLDDQALAATESERLRARKGLGRAGVAAELARKGAPRSAVDGALGGVDFEQELAGARAAGERWLRAHEPEGAALGRHLARKGYGGHVIFRVLKDLIPGGEPASDTSESP